MTSHASTTTPTQSRSIAIKRLSGQASTLAALLSVIDLLEPDHQHDALCTCASIAEELAQNIVAIIDGAA